jgi:translation initiation factor IF-2
MTKRLLVKVATELNVGTGTIVEFLSKKGYAVENKPMANISDPMYADLQREFQKSILIKGQADQLVIGTRPGMRKDAVTPSVIASTPLAMNKPEIKKPIFREESSLPPLEPKKEVKPEPVVVAAPKPVVVVVTPMVSAVPPSSPPPPPPAPIAPPPPPVVVVAVPVAPTVVVVSPPPIVSAPTPPRPAVVPAQMERRDENTLSGLKILGKMDPNPPRPPQQPPTNAPRRNDEARPRQQDQRNNTNDPNRGQQQNRGGSQDRPANANRTDQRNDQPRTDTRPPRTDQRNDQPRTDNRPPRTDQRPPLGQGQSQGHDNRRNDGQRPEFRDNRDNRDSRNSNTPGNNTNRPSTPNPSRPDMRPPARPYEPIKKPEIAPPPPVIEEEEEIIRAEAPLLKGLKIMGKVDSSRFDRGPSKDKDKLKKDEPKPRLLRPNDDGRNPARAGATISDDEMAKRKRKRKKVVGASAPQPPNPNAPTGIPGLNVGTIGKGNAPATTSTNRPATSGGGGAGNRRGGRNNEPAATQREVGDQMRATVAKMAPTGKNKRQKIRRDNRDSRREKLELAENEQETTLLQVTEFISLADLASLMDVSSSDLIMKCMSMGLFVSINERLDAAVIELLANEFDHEVEFISAEEQIDEVDDKVDAPEDLQPRPPIVTVMGHVDHGKTSLLDYIRSATVASGEAGGITQHIGAYEVVTKTGKKITFLDTPGHEAFTAMRARGAKVTDVAIIVVAADDNVMPQTKEAISHAQAAGVPIVFAINKIDKAGADPERIKGELAQMNLLVEDWGGKIQSQDISAKKGIAIEELLEKVLLEAELLELQANPNRKAVGTVVEASLDKGRGYVTKVLVLNGTLRIGDPMLAGENSGKIKAMFNERGVKIKTAGPGMPVLVLGLTGAPQAGEKFKIMASDSEARELATRRAQIMREQTSRANKRISLDEIGRRLALGTFKELNLIVKGDVDGSVEALSDSLIKLSVETVKVNVIHKAVGQIIESDVLLAAASDAIIVGFQVRPSLNARKLAEREGVEVKMYSIIYEAIDEIKAAIEGMLEPTKEEKIMGQVEIREVYKISKIGSIAGCYVQEGKITRQSLVRVVRDGIIVYPTKENAVAKLGSLKRFKEDMKEVKNNFECGLTIENFNDIKVGDIVEAYEIIEVKQTLPKS